MRMLTVLEKAVSFIKKYGKELSFSPHESWLCLVLLSYMVEAKKPECKVPQAVLINNCGISKATLHRSLKKLIDVGLISVVSAGRENIYIFNIERISR